MKNKKRSKFLTSSAVVVIGTLRSNLWPAHSSVLFPTVAMKQKLGKFINKLKTDVLS